MKQFGAVLSALLLVCGSALAQTKTDNKSASEVKISKELLISRGFGFDDRRRPMCTISGPAGPCRVEAFIADEKSVDEAAYSCTKLDKATYVGKCVNGHLEGLSIVIADGTTKLSREAIFSYFTEGRIAFPAITSYLDGDKDFGVLEKRKSYGCVYFGKWDESVQRCSRFLKIYGPDIFSESNAQSLRDGTFDLERYRVKFLEFLQGESRLGRSVLQQNTDPSTRTHVDHLNAPKRALGTPGRVLARDDVLLCLRASVVN